VVDPTLTLNDSAADAKAVGDALRSGFTEWELDNSSLHLVWTVTGWEPRDEYDQAWGIPKGNLDSVSLSWTAGVESADDITATRRLITPTKTSQLTNDGDGTNAFVKTNDPRLTDARTPTVHHATHAANGSDPLAPADIGAASLTDLPYALVEPGKWEFSGEGYDPSKTYSVKIVDWTDIGEGFSYDLYVNGVKVESLDFQSINLHLSVDFTESNITATRNSLPCHLLDRAVNAVSINTATAFTISASTYSSNQFK